MAVPMPSYEALQTVHIVFDVDLLLKFNFHFPHKGT